LKLRYPKIILSIIGYISAVAIYEIISPFLHIERLGHIGAFLAGILYVYTLTTGPATLMLIDLAKVNGPIIGISAGLGLLIGDSFILILVREVLSDEIYLLAEERDVKSLLSRIPALMRTNQFKVILSCILIALPLPTELGVVLLSSVKDLRKAELLALILSLHLIGVFSIIMLAQAI